MTGDKAFEDIRIEGIPSIRISRRSEQPLLIADRPYEDFFIGYVNVIHAGDTWHMWYLSCDQSYSDDRDGYLCYAKSSDGEHWEKPDLGLVEYNGDKNNNIIIAGPYVNGFHGQSVFLDPDAVPDERFKMVFSTLADQEWWVYGGVSPDGIHWKLLSEPLLKRNSDTQTVCFHDGDVYRLYVRMWTEGIFSGKRIVGYTESHTFGNFPSPRPILSPDMQDPDDLEFYNSGVSKLFDGLYIMFPSAFYTKADTVIPHIALGKDGITFFRPFREPILPLGKTFDSDCIYVAPGAIPAGKPGEYWCYYVGSSMKHNENLPGRSHYDGGIGRFLLSLEQ